MHRQIKLRPCRVVLFCTLLLVMIELQCDTIDIPIPPCRGSENVPDGCVNNFYSSNSRCGHRYFCYSKAGEHCGSTDRKCEPNLSCNCYGICSENLCLCPRHPWPPYIFT